MTTIWKQRATGRPGGMVADANELRRGFHIIADPENGCEVVALTSGRYVCLPGADIEGLVKAVEGMPAGIGVYVRANPVKLGLPKQATNGDVICRRWLYIDIDPVKDPAHKDEPASAAEKVRCSEFAGRVLDKLNMAGWPAPIINDSGNGYALLYRIDLPNDFHWKAILGRFMKSLADEFNGADGVIDRHVHNANRLVKLPGTWAKKGTASEDRPYRKCWIVSEPAELLAVPAALIEAAVDMPVQSATPPTQHYDPFKLRAGQGGHGAYARAAIDRECAKVSLSRPPSSGGDGRNNALNSAAFSLGTLVGSGELNRNEVENRLTLAAMAAGLDGGEIGSTIRSGMNAGMKTPRVIPERNGTPCVPASAVLSKDESIIVWASQIKTRPVEWLWPDRIPLGKLTTFAGIGGLGKTFVLCDITARVTRGMEWPDGSGATAVGKVLFISGEDDPDDTLVPRMIEMGADLSKVAFLKTEAADMFQLADMTMLEKAIADAGDGIRFVAIDPPTAYLGGVNDHNNAELRALLSPLKSWAARHRLACVFNTHVNKGNGVKVEAMMRVMGSVAWVNAVRAAHMFARDPEDRDKRLFLAMKNNLGPEKKGLSYKLQAVGELAKVQWLGEVDISADDAVNQSKQKNRDSIASDWLIERFREKLEWESDALFAAARSDGISRAAMYEAKAKLGLPRARRNMTESGNITFIWWVPADWSKLTGSSETESIPL